ncbi:MAG: hypothetical protein ACTSQX_12320 [Candidatus Heimdallarchaeota archaeon]
MIVRKHFKALLFGVFGYAVVFFTDDIIWLTIQKTRHIFIDGIEQYQHLFLAYFSFTYGIIMFSYAPIMFDKKISKLEKGFWSIGLFGGWLAIALLSQWISWNDVVVDIWREMGTTTRIIQILMVALGYLLLIVLNIILKYTNWNFIEPIPWRYFIYLFGVGIFIHLSMEATLTIANIRPLYWDVFFFDSIMEFNSGIPSLFIVWVLVNRKEYRTQEPAEDIVLDTPKVVSLTE